jgi:hypothetical protein
MFDNDGAKKKGVYEGRKPSVPVEAVRRMRDAGKAPAEIAEALAVSRMSVAGVEWSSGLSDQGLPLPEADRPSQSGRCGDRR